jgi:uncharacterized SAM-binding protein YcdF (DUF218 family)
VVFDVMNKLMVATYWWVTRGTGLLLCVIVIVVSAPLWVPLWSIYKLEEAAKDYTWRRTP